MVASYMGGGAKKSVSVLGSVSQDRAMAEKFPLVAFLTHGVIPAEAGTPVYYNGGPPLSRG